MITQGAQQQGQLATGIGGRAIDILGTAGAQQASIYGGTPVPGMIQQQAGTQAGLLTQSGMAGAQQAQNIGAALAQQAQTIGAAQAGGALGQQQALQNTYGNLLSGALIGNKLGFF